MRSQGSVGLDGTSLCELGTLVCDGLVRGWEGSIPSGSTLRDWPRAHGIWKSFCKAGNYAVWVSLGMWTPVLRKN